MDAGELASLLRDHALRYPVPGAAVGILRDGATLTACYGVADVATGEPVTDETRFSPGSLTKSMVATTIARLADAGRLSLEDPVAAHLPDMRGGWAETATLRSLLANDARAPRSTDLEFGFAGRNQADHDALARFVAGAASEPPSGPTWSYSNLGWCVLGRVIESVTDATWEDATRMHLLDPAGMRETAFATSAGAVRRATGHAVTPDGPAPIEPLVSRAYGPAGTSLVSTVPDLLRFCRLHLEDASLAPLRQAHSHVRIHAWLDAWCLGWARFDWDGGPVWGWDGMISGERSVLRLLPGHGAAVVLLTNSDAGRALYRSLLTDLMDAVFGIEVTPLCLEPAPGAAGDLSRFTGVYAWPDHRVQVDEAGDGLRMESEDGAWTARPIDGRTFLVDAADPDTPTVTFAAFDAAGRPQVLYEMLWGLPRVAPDEGSPPTAA
jgi:CubicO group peptidase (beta-lactamase class C family)